MVILEVICLPPSYTPHLLNKKIREQLSQHLNNYLGNLKAFLLSFIGPLPSGAQPWGSFAGVRLHELHDEGEVKRSLNEGRKGEDIFLEVFRRLMVFPAGPTTTHPAGPQ